MVSKILRRQPFRSTMKVRNLGYHFTKDVLERRAIEVLKLVMKGAKMSAAVVASMKL